MGKKGSTSTTVQSYTPTAEEVRLQKQAADYADAVAPNALNLNTIAANLLKNSYGTVQADYSAMNQAAQQQIANAQTGINNLANGQLPANYLANMQSVVNQGVQNSLGKALGSLSARGVLNSSVTNQAVGDIANAASNTMAQNYTNNIASLANLYNQQVANSQQGIATSAAAQEAAQKPAIDLWSASLGLNGGTTSALNAIAGKGQSTTTQTVPTTGLLGGVLTGAASGAISNLFCFVGETKIKTPTGEKQIRHVRKGDEIIAPKADGTQSKETVTAVMTPHYSDVYTVLAGEHAVSTTLSQPLLTSSGEMKLVESLTIGTELAGVGKVSGILYSGERKVYDFKTSGSNCYFADGFVAKGGEEQWQE